MDATIKDTDSAPYGARSLLALEVTPAGGVSPSRT
jgi:hypothetical protein